MNRFILAQDKANHMAYGLLLYAMFGFGDTNKYDQLTNGTDTDLNGNVIKTEFYGRRK